MHNQPSNLKALKYKMVQQKCFKPSDTVKLDTNLYNLPQESKDEMRSTFHYVLGTNVDDVTPNWWCRVKGQGLIFMNCESVQFPFVDSSFIHSTRHRCIDEFAKKIKQGIK